MVMVREIVKFNNRKRFLVECRRRSNATLREGEDEAKAKSERVTCHQPPVRGMQVHCQNDEETALFHISQLRLLPENATVTAAMANTNPHGLDLLIIADLAPSLSGSALPRQMPILSIQPGRRLQEARTVPDAQKAFIKYLIGTVAAITCACSQGKFFFCTSF